MIPKKSKVKIRRAAKNVRAGMKTGMKNVQSRIPKMPKDAGRIINKDLAKKLALGVILTVLLWSRVLSSYSSIQDVQASFKDDLSRGKINMPTVQDEEVHTAEHLNKQAQASSTREVRLQRLTERDRKIQDVKNFYARWNSPMAAQAEYIVDVSEMFGIDYRLLPAISIVESSGGQHNFRSYNAFGWGKSGFNSFEDAIYTVAKGLAYGYGTDNPYAIAPKYNPVTPDAWASKVSGLMSQI